MGLFVVDCCFVGLMWLLPQLEFVVIVLCLFDLLGGLSLWCYLDCVSLVCCGDLSVTLLLLRVASLGAFCR